jgi:cytoskeletal protein CcmA (bactofilin family)
MFTGGDTMRYVTRSVYALLLTLVALMATAPAAGAQSDDDDLDNIVVLTGRAEVRSGETVDNVFIVDGPVVIEGTVRDAVVAVNGDIRVDGTVEDDVVAIDGRVTISSSGTVEGDVISRNRPVTDGELGGSWQEWDLTQWDATTAIAGRLVMWLAFSISSLVLGLLLLLIAPRAAEATESVGRRRLGATILWGVVLLIGLPIVAALALITLVGIPLGLWLLLALWFIYWIGYTVGAWVLGRRIVRTASPFLAFLAGWAILRVLALIPIVGGLAWLAAVIVGLGAIVVAGRERRAVIVREPAVSTRDEDAADTTRTGEPADTVRTGERAETTTAGDPADPDVRTDPPPSEPPRH